MGASHKFPTFFVFNGQTRLADVPDRPAGIQTTNSNGEVTFTTIYPGWYQGRATHIHIEVKTGGVSRKVTQIAFPESINNTVYASGVYASRGSNPMSNLADGIFADSLSSELVTPTGSPTSGYSASCQVAIAV